MNKEIMRVLYAIIGLLLVQPIWYFLLFKILKSINATEIMWFLYWIYVPASFIVLVIFRLLENAHTKGE